MSERDAQQLELLDLGVPATARPPGSGDGITPAPPSETTAALARGLPAELRLGTSSWSFPGWAGLVYGGRFPTQRLAREGLGAYARHPLLRAVGIDRSYYAPLAAREFAAYAAEVGADFRFLVKAHEHCTRAWLEAPGARGAARRPNPRFLDAAYAAEAVVAPFAEGLGARAGPLVFQFPPQDPAELGGPEGFAAALHAFLDALPRGPLYAVEIRTRSLLCGAYAQALAAAGACHCVSVHPRMPPPAEQAAQAGVGEGPALVVRWMLGGAQRYEAARRRYQPFDRLVDPDPRSRSEIAALCLRSARAARPAFVIVNNKAEGSAPLSILELARAVGEAAP